jgi:GTP-binding protein
MAMTPEHSLLLASRTAPLRLEFVQSGSKVEDLGPHVALPELALVGRSNVGKSSLLNFMAGAKQLARVSALPGRTQLINLFRSENPSFQLADLPGYGFALSPREVQAHWSGEMARYFEDRPNLKGILFLFDARRDVESEDVRLVQWFLSLGLGVLVLQTKCDKIHKSQWAMVRQKHAAALKMSAENVISTSSEKRVGLDSLFAGMAGLMGVAGPTQEEGP